MDKEMKQCLLQMLELLLARQEEVAAPQEKMYAELKAAILASFRGSTNCQTETMSSSEEMEAMNLEATPEETEAAVERQDIFEEEINAENIGPSEDRCEEQRLAVRCRRGAKKRTQDKNNVARGASRRKMLDKRQRNNSVCEDGRLGRDLKKRLRLWPEGTSRSLYN
jgi:hypothetical protein